jgi:hypothetical protein
MPRYGLILCVSSILFIGCGPSYVLLTNDRGERVVCERPLGTTDGSFTQGYAQEARLSECVKAHEKIGFRRVQ